MVFIICYVVQAALEFKKGRVWKSEKYGTINPSAKAVMCLSLLFRRKRNIYTRKPARSSLDIKNDTANTRAVEGSVGIQCSNFSDVIKFSVNFFFLTDKCNGFFFFLTRQIVADSAWSLEKKPRLLHFKSKIVSSTNVIRNVNSLSNLNNVKSDTMWYI